MLLTVSLLTCCALIGLGTAGAAFSLLEVLFETPAVSARQVDTRREAVDALATLDTDTVHAEVLRNVSQSA